MKDREGVVSANDVCLTGNKTGRIAAPRLDRKSDVKGRSVDPAVPRLTSLLVLMM